MSKKLYILLFPLFLFCGVPSAAELPEDDIPTNLQWLESVLDSSLTNIVKQNVLKSNETVYLEVTSNDPVFNDFQQSYLRQKFLIDSNVTIVHGNLDVNSYDKKLVIRWVNWKVIFQKKKKMFWRKSKYLRNLLADFFVEVEDLNSSTVIYAKRNNYQLSDIINNEKLKSIRNIQLPFTMGQLIENKGIVSRLMEPVFLFAISGTVVYLFYSIRSE